MKSGWIDHRGVKIFIADYSHFMDLESLKAEVDYATNITINEPENSVRLLVDVTGTLGDAEMVDCIKESAGKDDDNMKKAAVVGVSGYRRIFLRAVLQFTKLSVKTFDNLEEAKDWLAED
ncbi:STAS/SEC14 domain-containing protein [candidate division KSB1 bacterium]|nr:STAS/SEC14 domain-containing protein [candidate division KSB1 bacterium]